MERSSAERVLRERFGGLNFGAAFFGWLVAIGIGTLAIALLSALGSAVAFNVSQGNIGSLADNGGTVGLLGALALLAAMAVAYFAGGYVAGRMSRFDGAEQGRGVWLIGLAATIILAIAGLALGSGFNLLQQLNLPNLSVNPADATLGGLISLIVTLAVTYMAATFGGRAGVRYHKRVDQAATKVADEDSRNRARDLRFQPTFGETVDSHRDDHDNVDRHEREREAERTARMNQQRRRL